MRHVAGSWIHLVVMGGRFMVITTSSGVRHLLSIAALDPSEVQRILDRAELHFRQPPPRFESPSPGRRKAIAQVFYEPSTRTRSSFELAGKRLGADVLHLGGSESSVKKGESLRDTMQTLAAMRADAIVLRHPAAGAADYVASRIDCAVVNAGDGAHEHPTQALLDAFVIRKHRGQLTGLTVCICGDIAHSRVARSNALLLQMFGCELRFLGPQTLLPRQLDALGGRRFERFEAALEGADVVMALRIQQERLQTGLLPSLREYSCYFGLNAARLRHAKSDALVMHPGPMNRGVEISSEVADGAQSRVLDQVEAGVAVRMAVLERATSYAPQST